MDIPSLKLKIIFLAHFVLTAWATQALLLPVSYAYYNAIFLIILLWGIHHRDSEEPIFMGVIVDCVSILMDIVIISEYFVITKGSSYMGFVMGMAIFNLLLRPVSVVLLIRIQHERVGNYNNFGIPGLGDYFGRRGPYENIDQPIPQSVPQTTVDTGSPHHVNFGSDKPMPPP